MGSTRDRERMVRAQIAARGIRDEAVLGAFRSVPREAFLPPELREFAWLGQHGMLIGQGNRFELWDETRWNGRRDLWLRGEEGGASDLPSELDSLSL